MDHGRIIALGDTAVLKSAFSQDTVVTVRARGDRTSLMACLLKAIDGDPAARLVDGGVELRLPPDPSLVNRLVRSADDAGFQINGLTVEDPSLEDVFISLTGRELRD
jgi:ABC-2 type transport system ATP-binding protein